MQPVPVEDLSATVIKAVVERTGIDPELIVETEDVIAGRAATRPPRLLGFGLRLAGRLVRLLGASLTVAASPEGTTCHLIIPDLAGAESGRSAQAASA